MHMINSKNYIFTKGGRERMSHYRMRADHIYKMQYGYSTKIDPIEINDLSNNIFNLKSQIDCMAITNKLIKKLINIPNVTYTKLNVLLYEIHTTNFVLRINYKGYEIVNYNNFHKRLGFKQYNPTDYKENYYGLIICKGKRFKNKSDNPYYHLLQIIKLQERYNCLLLLSKFIELPEIRAEIIKFLF